jgi:hypothetical protein
VAASASPITAAASAVPWNPQMVKIGLIVAGIVVVGGIAAFAIKGAGGGDGEAGRTSVMATSRTKSMKSNPGRRRKHRARRKSPGKTRRRLRRNGKKQYTKAQVVKMFRDGELKQIVARYGNDKVAIRTGYNDFTDSLHKAGEISDRVYNSSNPFDK